MKSIKGREVNLSELKRRHAKDTRLGNSGKNVNGDLITRNGSISKTREQLAFEYNRKPPNAAKTIPVSETNNLAKATQPVAPQAPSKPNQ